MSSPGKHPDLLVHGREPFNAETPRQALVRSAITPTSAFYVRNHGPVPEIDPVQWRLRVDGLLARPLELSLPELQRRFAARTLVATLQCAGNRRQGLMAVREVPGETPWGPGATGSARWTGAALAEVLEAARPDAEAREVAFEGADVSPEADPPQPFGASVSLKKALAGEVLLAWEMNGEPLPRLHGAPLRVVVPGYIGARSVKWLRRITVGRHPTENPFQATYRLLPPEADPDTAPPGAGVVLGAVAVNAEILEPGDGDRPAAGPVTVRGYAFAGDDRRIVRVDVSVDGGRRWQQAELLEDLGPWAWRRWQTQVTLAPGHAEIVARAWDSAGATQPEDPGTLWNPKGYINNAWSRVTLEVGPTG